MRKTGHTVTHRMAMSVRDDADCLQRSEEIVRVYLHRGELAGKYCPAGWQIDDQDFQSFLLAIANVDLLTWRRWLKKSGDHNPEKLRSVVRNE